MPALSRISPGGSARRHNQGSAIASALFAAGLFALPSPSVAAACDTAGLRLPAGYCATLFAQDNDQPRHIAVGPDGTVYANLSRPEDGHDLLAMRDSNGDGKADQTHTFGNGGATGLTLHNGWLYAAGVTDIWRYPISHKTDSNGPSTDMPASDSGQRVVRNLPMQRTHAARGLAVDDHDHLFVAIGAPSNACQKADRVPGSMGQDPCPLLKTHGGVWQFSASQIGQRFSPDKRFATGVRNLFALAWDTQSARLYGVQMGRDQLDSLWPKQFNTKQGVNLPAEVLLAVEQDSDFGWPYCYYDNQKQANLLNPEYGGDASKVGTCDTFAPPIAAYPAHWAPMAMAFKYGDSFPAPFNNGAFIAFHGSWNRAPAPQGGFQVIFQPFADGKPSGQWRTFAGEQGFTGEQTLRSPSAADHRPSGLAVGPHGALYISDDRGGAIYRVTYQGQ